MGDRVRGETSNGWVGSDDCPITCPEMVGAGYLVICSIMLGAREANKTAVGAESFCIIAVGTIEGVSGGFSS